MYKQVNGMYDYLPLDCYCKDKVASALLKVFGSHGYRKIETPALEYYDLFTQDNINIDATKLFKLTDSDGSILVMRPDMTLPISRVVTTKLQDASRNKYCYIANSYSFKQRGNDIREFTQAGVELFAPQSPYVDADIIALAIESLLAAGLKDFIIDIGHVGYFKGVLKELNLSNDKEAELVKIVNAKDALGIELFTQKSVASNKLLSLLLQLPTQFGGAEIIDEIIATVSDIKSLLQPLHELKHIVDILKGYGYDKYICIDLSLVNGISYYSGVVFKGMSKYIGTAVLGGGRYDNLTNAFGKQLDATGFAIGVNHLLEASRRENNNNYALPQIDIYIGGSSKSADITHSYITKKIAEGNTVENSYIEDINIFKQEFARINAKGAVFFDSNGNITEL